MPTARARLLALLIVALLAVAAAAPAARANGMQISIMQDDDHLVYRSDAVRDATLKRMKTLGVDYVRVTVLWKVVANGAKSTKRRARKFRGSNPRTYPIRNWDRYDNLVRSAQNLGIGIYFNPTAPGPSWAHARTRDRSLRGTYKPKEREYYRFVAALAKRYSGRYRDENTRHAVIGRVSVWSLQNEPNQGGWLTPQYERSRLLHRKIPMSPVLDRTLFFFGRKALRDNGHGGDVIMAGETAPIGNSATGARSPMRPKKFIREFFCVDGRLRPLRGRAARARRCGDWKRFGPISAGAWDHHPYTKRLAPTRRDPNRDSLTMANIGDLPAMLDAIAKNTGRVAPALSVWLTEFGYETKPPDPFAHTSLAQQAEYLNVGDYIAYRNPRIYANTQFLLTDVPPVKSHKKGSKAYWFTYQSGLYTARDKAKPAAAAYTLPLVVNISPDGNTANIWGQLRFLPNGQPGQVELQWRPQGAQSFVTQGAPERVTSSLNFFETARYNPGPGVWRARWVGPGTLEAFSRAVPAGS